MVDLVAPITSSLPRLIPPIPQALQSSTVPAIATVRAASTIPTIAAINTIRTITTVEAVATIGTVAIIVPRGVCAVAIASTLAN